MNTQDEPARNGSDPTPLSPRLQAQEHLQSPDLVDYILAGFRALGLDGEEENALTVYLTATSRLLPKTLATYVLGSSSSGKSHILEIVATTIPPEEQIDGTDMTPQSLYYLPEGKASHKWIVLGERHHRIDADMTTAFRELYSRGRLRKWMPIRKKDGLETVLIETEGPTAFSQSTTAQLFEEDANRGLLLQSDETSEQTVRIRDGKSQRAESKEETIDAERLLEVMHEFQRLLKKVTVRVPYLRKVLQKLPVEPVQVRRVYDHIERLIQASACLHQHQRKKGHIDDGDVIEANIDDYRIARQLLVAPLGHALGSTVSPQLARFAKLLKETFKSRTFAVKSILPATELSRSTVHKNVKELVNVGVLRIATEQRGSQPARYEILRDVPKAGDDWLPLPEEI